MTVPPCEEGIKWTVVKDVQPISVEQYWKVTTEMERDHLHVNRRGNNRAIQPLNNRDLYYNSASTLTMAML